MEKIIRKTTLYVVILLLLLTGAGCNSWLDLLPENSQTSDMYWNTKEDVEAVVLSGYTSMRDCLLQLVQWGELRGDALSLDVNATTEELQIAQMDIRPENSICKWDKFYKVIGNANAVIKYAPEVQAKDPTFTVEQMNSYIGEALFMRTLCYFYLVRAFGEVPLVLEPYVDDQISFQKAKSSEEAVLARLRTDIEEAIRLCKPGYGDALKNKARATRWAAHALKADICLWSGEYDGTLAACEAVISSNQYRLVSTLDWFTIFSPEKGSSVEGIFELYWKDNAAGTTGLTNSLYTWFWDTPRYLLSYRSNRIFTEFAEEDYRGLGASYQADGKIWKYTGTEATVNQTLVRPAAQRNSNWIFYRYADVLLMKAEALVMKDEANIGEAWNILEEIRLRAGHSIHPPQPSARRTAMEGILNERQMEFVAEGKRWFDILRMGKRNNYEFRDYIIDVISENLSARDRARLAAKLRDERGYFFPIHEGDINANRGVLVQNPFYEDLE